MGNEGKKVKAHYIGTLDDGTKFDSSFDRDEPIEFICCAGQMIPGFDAAVKEMAVGETKKIRIPTGEAYGDYNPNLVQRVPVTEIAGVEDMPVGETIFLSGPGGQPLPVLVIEKNDEYAVFDMNHELAGKDLSFEITLVEVSE